MDFELLEKARERISSVPVLINVLSKRVQQLNTGFHPMVKRMGPDEENMDLALREVAQGMIIAEIDFSAIQQGESSPIEEDT